MCIRVGVSVCVCVSACVSVHVTVIAHYKQHATPGQILSYAGSSLTLYWVDSLLILHPAVGSLTPTTGHVV